MEIVRPILALIHVGAALIYVTGYASTKTLSRLAVAEADPTRRRVIFSLGDKFDFRFQIVGGTLVGPSGLLLSLANGYSLTPAWVALSIAIYAALCSLGRACGGADRSPFARHSTPVTTLVSSGC